MATIHSKPKFDAEASVALREQLADELKVANLACRFLRASVAGSDEKVVGVRRSNRKFRTSQISLGANKRSNRSDLNSKCRTSPLSVTDEHR